MLQNCIFFLTILCAGFASGSQNLKTEDSAFALSTPPAVDSSEDDAHYFSGQHFLASYLDCDLDALHDVDQLLQAMDEAVGSCGATVLNKTAHVFPPSGLTVVYLLSESHASIHTYPEFGTCFIDLFTCGNNCSAEKFDAALRAYLQPKEVSARFFLRNEGIKEIDYQVAQ